MRAFLTTLATCSAAMSAVAIMLMLLDALALRRRKIPARAMRMAWLVVTVGFILPMAARPAQAGRAAATRRAGDRRAAWPAAGRHANAGHDSSSNSRASADHAADQRASRGNDSDRTTLATRLGADSYTCIYSGRKRWCWALNCGGTGASGAPCCAGVIRQMPRSTRCPMRA